MKKLLWSAAAVICAVLLVLFLVVPPLLDSRINRLAITRFEFPSAEARELHSILTIVDLHADSLLWGRDLLERSTRGEVDVPRLIEGNVALEVFTAVTKSPRGLNYEQNSADSDNILWLAVAQRWPVRTWNSLTERALFLAERFHHTAASSHGRFVPIRSARELAGYLERRRSEPKITAGMLGIEGAHALDGRLENLDRLYDAGYRYISLAHFFDDEFAGSSAGVGKGGLTPLGRQLLHRMNDRKIIIDLAHASPATIRDVLQETKRPVIFSHGGLQGNCNNRRNLSDQEARGIAASGGIIGIGFWPAAVCGNDPQAIARALRYAVDLVGVEHVALGSDFDGAIHPPFDAANLSELTEALLEAGFTKAEIRAISGENALRFFRENLPD
jgi:membrane dipeptidase